MLKRTQRIGRIGLAEVLAAGKPLRSSHFSIKYLAATSPLQCAVVVSKKVAKSAVQRNKLRRAAYRALAAHATKTQKHGRMVLFIQKIPTSSLTPAFSSDLESIWLKIN